MSDPDGDMSDGVREGALTLIAQAAVASAGAHRWLPVSIDDFFLPDMGRLDERTRVSLSRLLRALVATVADELRAHAARLLRARDEMALATALDAAPDLLERVGRSGLLRDPELIGELLGRVREELLAGAMLAHGSDEPERPSLINRLVQHPDRVVAQSSMAVLIAESRRRNVPEAGPLPQTDLPAELHHKLVWWVAAALREVGIEQVGPSAALEWSLAEAAQRSLAAHDEAERLEAAVVRLAAAIDAQPHELADVMTEAIGDRRVTLFSGLLAHALGVDYAVARDITLEAHGERLWVALRAVDCGREAIARIGVALSEADPRRDLERFAAMLDSIMSIETTEAREALAMLRLPVDFRTAIVTLERRFPWV